MDQGPVFVGGLSRSGKTLLCSLLALHPNIAMPLKESNLWTFFYRRHGDLSQPENFERCLAAMWRYKGVRLLNPNPERIRAEFWQGEPTYARLFALLHTHYAEQLGKPRWGVQAVSEEAYTELIFAAYPTAKMVHMIRDPRDLYLAQITTRSVRGWRKVATATGHWLHAMSLAKRYQQRYPHRYKILRYETLVSQPQNTLAEVCAFLNEDYIPAPSTIDSTLRYQGGDISAAFVGSFRQGLSQRDLNFIQTYAWRDMAAHNYQLESIRFSPGDYPLFYLVDQPINLVYMVAWHIMKNIQFKFPSQLGATPAPRLLVS